MFSRHAITAFIALLLPVALWIGMANMSSPARLGEGRIVIAMEHRTPLTVSLTHAREERLHRLDIAHDGEEALLVSLPEDWRRDEVRNVALEDVTSEEPNLGYVRWTLPPMSDVTFESPNNWSSAELQNPTGVPLGIRLTTVDLAKNTSDYRVILLKDDPVSIP